jgi:glycerol-3-phosphate acyltransferase PlsX
VEDPTVGLLNVGTEEGKGNELAKEAYSLLNKSGLNFIGNVEGSDILTEKATVVLCDGFVGNILVKFSEGLAGALGDWLSQELRDALPQEKLEGLAKKLIGLIGPAEFSGGTLLWGIDGVFATAHGNSRAAQILGTIEQAKRAVETHFIASLRGELERVGRRIEL